VRACEEIVAFRTIITKTTKNTKQTPCILFVPLVAFVAFVVVNRRMGDFFYRL